MTKIRVLRRLENPNNPAIDIRRILEDLKEQSRGEGVMTESISDLRSQVQQIEDEAVDRFMQHIRDVIEYGVDPSGGDPTPGDAIDLIMDIVEWTRENPHEYAKVIRAYVHARTRGDVRYTAPKAEDMSDGPLKKMMQYAEQLEREAWQDDEPPVLGTTFEYPDGSLGKVVLAKAPPQDWVTRVERLVSLMVKKGILEDKQSVVEAKSKELAALTLDELTVQEKAVDLYDASSL